MARSFHTHVPTPWLDGGNIRFGRVTKGMDVLMSIPPRTHSGQSIRAEKLRAIVPGTSIRH